MRNIVNRYISDKRNRIALFSKFAPVKKSYHKLPRVHENIRDTNIPFSLSKENSHYLSVVMRMKCGHYFRAFNENGEFLCVIDGLSSPKNLRSGMTTSASVVEVIRQCELSYQIATCLYVSPIRSRHMKKMVEMVSELGVTTIVPVIFKNTNAKLDSVESLQRIAVGATEQSERLSIPQICEPIAFSKLVDNRRESQQFGQIPLLLCRERSLNSSQPILTCLSHLKWSEEQPVMQVDIMVGPEGGFIDSEIETINGLENVHMISIESNVLRTETAAVVAMSCIRNYLFSTNMIK